MCQVFLASCAFIHDFLQFTAPLALGLGLLANHDAELLYRNCCAPYTARVIRKQQAGWRKLIAALSSQRT
jgi:hypothetical protein